MGAYSALKGFYNVEKTLGCGGFAKVKLATHIATGEKVAIKIMEKNGLGNDLPRVKLEIMALKNLCHEHICKLYQVLETVTHYFIVIEYCSGGELFDHIVEKNRLSENQSRTFFRQILSAVAYLHSRGYAHRDLKPENVLLNGDKLLKLIDFGLCAKPEGGTTNTLSTSCGSPTYAAPELVQGQSYLGAEVDVWSMGVLLYTLLCGFLPFDDCNIDSLYKKIMNGQYFEPTFLSTSSRNILKSMLQVDPKKRITIKKLLSHSWITAAGVFEPVAYMPENVERKDNECISIMAEYHSVTSDEMWKNLKTWKFDYNSATYFLLCHRKQRGLSLRLNSTSTRSPIVNDMIDKSVSNQQKTVLQPMHRNMLLNSPIVPKTFERINNAVLTPSNHNRRLLDCNSVPCRKWCEPKSPFVEPVVQRRQLKRVRSPTTDSDFSPVPAKKPATPLTSPRTPETKKPPINHENQGSARKVLGSIERSLNKVRHVLRPRKLDSDQLSLPTVLTNKDLCNVSTTQCNDPEFVITELAASLRNKGMSCVRKGFRLRGKVDPSNGNQLGGCSFELEICYLPSSFDSPIVKKGKSTIFSPSTPKKQGLQNWIHHTNSPTNMKQHTVNCTTSVFPTVLVPPIFVGVRRKRLKGDSWCYKKVCEEVLALTSVGFKPRLESSV